MIQLNDVKDYIAGLGVAQQSNCYCGVMPNKPQEAIGVYPLQRRGTPYIPVGNASTYEERGISILVHWNKSVTDTELASFKLFEKILESKGTISNRAVKHIKPLVKEPISIGTDENGIQEYVIECIIYLEKEN